MRTRNLRTALLSFPLMLAAGCGGSSPKNIGPAQACVSSSTPAFAYVLVGQTISMYTVNSCTGALTSTAPATIATGGNAFGAESLVVDPTGKFVYVANLESNASDLATISMFTIDSKTGLLTPTSPPTVPTGYFPQGMAVDPSGRFVYTANSDDNTVSSFTINRSTGVLSATTPATVATGWSPLSVTVDPSGRFAYVSNQDDDTESMYSINATTGVLTPLEPATVSTEGSPFKATVDPSGRFVYVPNAYSGPNNFVSQYKIDPSTGVLTPNTPVAVSAGNSPTSVAVDPSSKFAYVVDRQDNTVSMFTIDPATGNLAPKNPSTIATGREPFSAIVDPTGKFAYVTNENDIFVSIYNIKSDGTLSSAGVAGVGSGSLVMSVIQSKQ